MEYIDVRGVPEALARALQAMVDALRARPAPAPANPSPQPVGPLTLDRRQGSVIGHLSREELYDDVA
jgi:hypothetical protein